MRKGLPLHRLSLWQASQGIRDRVFTPLDLVEAGLDRIRTCEPRVHAWITVTEEDALQAAWHATQEMAGGHYYGPLHGIPIGHKDVFLTRGVRTTAHSRHLLDWVPSVSATMVTRLQALGAISLGKTACHEFAFGSPAPDDLLPPARNPWQPAHMPGSSSSGSAVAVALGMCMAATGTDTGGSIRHPAAACGLVGLKPTRHTYPMQGVLALAPSLDVAGFLTRSTLDQAVLWDAWHGTQITALCLSQSPAEVLRGLRIGIPEGLWEEGDGSPTHHPQIRTCFEDLLRKLQALGAQVVPVSLPARDEVVKAANTVIAFEAFGQLQKAWREHPEALGQGLRQKLASAETIALDDYHAAGVQAVQWGQLLSALMPRQVDVFMWPGREQLPETMQSLMDRPTAQRSACNRLYSLTGHPALTGPMGVAAEGLPMAVQIGAAWHQEPLLMQIGHALEQVQGWQLPALMD